jgi:hypothetical protein
MIVGELQSWRRPALPDASSRSRAAWAGRRRGAAASACLACSQSWQQALDRSHGCAGASTRRRQLLLGRQRERLASRRPRAPRLLKTSHLPSSAGLPERSGSPPSIWKGWSCSSGASVSGMLAETPANCAIQGLRLAGVHSCPCGDVPGALHDFVVVGDEDGYPVVSGELANLATPARAVQP